MGSGSVKKALVRLAQVRTKTVQIDGLDVLVREIGAAEFARYGEMVKSAKAGNYGSLEANAFLLSSCIVEERADDNGVQLVQVYTEQEAVDIARSVRVTMPIVNAIMELSGLEDKEDKKPGQPDASRDVRPPAGGPSG